ncbi:MAG: bifunctional pyr operon transcriptional regulator/uracil phosphoribosyltransferase PyrR [Cyanobacteria bacterium]|nr:bifunctional pyr operon transcriptional regulator/uracil phosphoribosyltransferase PyrR [Cyanobacteriota bacterium]
MAGNKVETTILTADDIERMLKRLTHELIEANRGVKDIVLLGVVTRGDILARRIGRLIETFEERSVPVGTLDITLYRDDSAHSLKPTQASDIPVDLSGKHVILVDDVIFSGRTVRAALDALNDFGRPATVQLLVLLDRGHRQLPISPNFVGKNLPTAVSEQVQVQLLETDGAEKVTITK